MTMAASKVQLGLLRFWLQLFRWTPKPVISFMGWVATAFIPLFRKERTRIAKNIHRVYNLPPHSVFAKMFCRQVLRHQIRSSFETFKELQCPGSIRVVGLERYREHMGTALAAGKGVIIITGHLGSWELVARYGAAAAGMTFTALAKPSKNQAVTAVLDGLRGHGNTRVIWTGSKNILREMLATLRGNKPLGFVMDQKPDQRRGPMVEFLGQESLFVAGPAKLALKTGAAVLEVFCLRKGPWQFEIQTQLHPAVSPDSDEVAVTQMFAQRIEAAVRAYPEQWLWNYKRW